MRAGSDGAITRIEADPDYARAVVESNGRILADDYDLTPPEEVQIVERAKKSVGKKSRPEVQEHYRNEELGFEMALPGGWAVHGPGSVRSEFVPPGMPDTDLVFSHSADETLYIVIEVMWPEQEPEYTEQLAMTRARAIGGDSVEGGRITVGGREHAWVRFRLPGGIGSKAYVIVWNGKAYSLTASLKDVANMAAREELWDQIAASFRLLVPVSPAPGSFTPGPSPDPAPIPGPEVYDPMESPESVINLASRMLSMFDRKRDPERWAGVQVLVGEGYRNRVKGDRVENIEKAIYHYEQVLLVSCQRIFPELWAAAHNNLTIVYSKRSRGSKAENLEKAVEHGELALQVYKRRTAPEDWAMMQNNLAEAHQKRIHGNREENVRMAETCYQRALEVYTLDSYPVKFADTHYNMMFLYGFHTDFGPALDITRAIYHGEEALKGYNRENHPEDWAMVHSQIGHFYVDPKLDWGDGRFEKAKDHCELALQVYTRETHSVDWARTMFTLAQAYAGRKQGSPLENVDKVIECVSKAMEILTRNAYPDQWRVMNDFLTAAREYRRSQFNEAGQGPRLTYPHHYIYELDRQRGEPGRLTLDRSLVMESPFVNTLILEYRWAKGPSDEEARKLCKRVVMYIACAIYDAAQAARLPCEPSAVPNGQRPAWIIPGERVPVSLTLSEVDMNSRICHMVIGAMMTTVGEAPAGVDHWKRLKTGFEERFGVITV